MDCKERRYDLRASPFAESPQLFAKASHTFYLKNSIKHSWHTFV